MALTARITTKNHQGYHQQSGEAETADMVLVTGKDTELSTVNFWPWSPKSVNAATGHILATAERMGYEIE